MSAETFPPIWDELASERAQLIRACRAVLLFYELSGADWRLAASKWERLTGSREATTRTLCDFIRATLVNAGVPVKCPTCGEMAPPFEDSRATGELGEVLCGGCGRRLV